MESIVKNSDCMELIMERNGLIDYERVFGQDHLEETNVVDALQILHTASFNRPLVSFLTKMGFMRCILDQK